MTETETERERGRGRQREVVDPKTETDIRHWW